MELAGTSNLSIIFPDLTGSLDFIVVTHLGMQILLQSFHLIKDLAVSSMIVLEIVHWFLTSIYVDPPVL